MEHTEFTQAMGHVFSLKHVLFNGFDPGMLGLPINRTQQNVLMIAWRHPATAMQILSRQAALEKGSLTTVIDSLEKEGYVQRIKNEGDRRSFIIQVTPKGTELAEKIDALFRIHLENLLSVLPQDQQNSFRQAIFTLSDIIPHLAS